MNGPVAQESPTQTWLGGWVDYLQTVGALILIVAIMAMAIWILVRATIRVTIASTDGRATHFIRRGGVGATLAFLILASLVYWLLTHTEALAGFFGDELPIGR